MSSMEKNKAMNETGGPLPPPLPNPWGNPTKGLLKRNWDVRGGLEGPQGFHLPPPTPYPTSLPVCVISKEKNKRNTFFKALFSVFFY